jgi:hypothetical protein
MGVVDILRPLKVPKCEIFDNSDIDDFYIIKALWGATFGLKQKIVFLYLWVRLGPRNSLRVCSV